MGLVVWVLWLVDWQWKVYFWLVWWLICCRDASLLLLKQLGVLLQL
jgi:hypothetical protein